MKRSFGKKIALVGRGVGSSLSRETLHKARALAAHRTTTISKLVAEQIEALVSQNEAYQDAEHQALVLLDKGFSLGGGISGAREEWQER